MKKSLASFGTLLAFLVASVHSSFADDIAVAGREIYNKHKDAIVTVQLVINTKFSMPGLGGEGDESKQDVTGTVIDPSGLTVLSLSETDPGQFYASMMQEFGGDSGDFQMETELSSINLLLPDGQEIAAEVVLRDRDLDLAFVRPTDKLEKPMAAIDLNDAGEAELLDRVVTINRLGRVARRVHAASLERISAIVDRPRKFYVPGGGYTATALGSPAFTTDGKVLGIFVMRSIRGGGGSAMGMFDMQPDNIAAIILPAADIKNAARQVPKREGE